MKRRSAWHLPALFLACGGRPPDYTRMAEVVKGLHCAVQALGPR